MGGVVNGSAASRVCKCGCAASMVGKRSDAEFASGACRARYARARVNPSSQSTEAHRGAQNAPTRPRKPDKGVRVFFSSVDQAAQAAERLRTEWARTGRYELLKASEAIDRAVDRKRARG
jgi:hypothetical protein